MDVAHTILAQLGGSRFIAMTGARNLVGGNDSLSFKIGRNCSGITHVRITLTTDDLYNVDFFAVRSLSVKTKASYQALYADQLQAVFTDETGMYTRL
jgi:hypothetical protein